MHNKKLFFLFIAAAGAITLGAADPDGVWNGWDCRSAKETKTASIHNGKILQIKNDSGTIFSTTRFRSLKCSSGWIAKLKFKVSGNAEISAGCHAYTLRNIWTGRNTGETVRVSSEHPAYFEWNIPITMETEGQVVAIRPYLNVNAGGYLNVHDFECKLKTSEPPPEQMITGGTFPKYFRRFTNKDGDFNLRILPSYNKIILDLVETPFTVNGVHSLHLSLISEKDGSIVLQKTIPFAEGAIKAWVTDIPDSLAGDFRVEGKYLNASGKTVLQGRGITSISFMDLDSGWYRVGELKRNANLPNMVQPYPMGQKVFHFGKYPFQEMNINAQAIPGFPDVRLKGNTISIINRDYVIGKNGLPESIIVRQLEPTCGQEYEEILAAPIAVLLNGKEMKNTSSSSIRKENGTVHTQAVLDNVVKINTVIEADGVIKITVELLKNTNSPLQTLTFAVPVKKEIATLFHEQTDVTYRSNHQNNTGFAAGSGGHSGFLPHKKIAGNIVWQSSGLERSGKGSFNPFVWLGNEDRGICFFGDTDENFITDDPLPCQSIESFEDKTVLNINLINKSALGKWQREKISFGLLATPVKLPPENFRGTIFPRWATLDKDFYSKLTNVRKIIPVGAGHPRFNAGTCTILPLNDEISRKTYEDLRQDGKNSIYMEYFCSDYINLSSPELAMYFGEWISGYVDKYSMQNPGSWYKHSNSYSFPQASWIGVRRLVPSYLQYRLWCLEEKIKKIGAYSFYEDNIHHRKFFDPALGYGYFDDNGDPRWQFDTWSLRDYFRKIAVIFARNNMENLSGAHASGAMNIPAMTCATYYIDGEQPGHRVLNDSMDYVTLWQKNLEYLRSHILGRQFGIRTIFLSSIIFRSSNATVNLRQSRAFLAVILPHDLGIWDGMMHDRTSLKNWHKIVNDLNFFDNHPRLLPYWGSTAYRAVEHDLKDLYVTGYRQPEQVLLVLSNFGESRKAAVTLNTTNFGFIPVTAVDMENSANAVKLENNVLTVDIPRHDYRLILLKSNSANL